jgi:hypothetical protein
MSTKVETLQARRAGGSILLAAFLVSLVVLTIAAVAISFDSDQGRQGETTFVGRQVVSTPSEVSGGVGAGLVAGSYEGFEGGVPQHHFGGAEQTFVGGTAANTPSELNARFGAGKPKTVAGGTLANTPTELSGGIIAHNRRR